MGITMYDARSRSRFRLLVTALTGAATIGSLTAAGVTTGALARAADDSEATGAADEVANSSATTPEGTRVVRWQDRPRRTVVRRHRVVRVAPAVPEDAAVPAPGDPLGGGTVTPVAPQAPVEGAAPAPPAGSGSSGSSGGTGGTGGTGGGTGGGAGAQPTPPPSQPVEPPPPVPPAPEPPVPSTGS